MKAINDIINELQTGGKQKVTGKKYKELRKRSEEAAYRAVFDEYSAYVYTIVYNRASSASKEDIEECVCDVFADVFFRYEPEGDGSADMRPFIGTVAKNAATDLYRRISRLNAHTEYMEQEDLDLIPSEHDAEAEAEQAEMSRLLTRRIKEPGEPDSIARWNTPLPRPIPCTPFLRTVREK